MTTPETLRKLANMDEPLDDYEWFQSTLFACAAAWEADRKRLEAAEKRPKHRMVIVWDGDKWHSRQLAYSVQDDIIGEMVYHCDKPLVNDADSVLAALAGEEKP